MTTQKPQKDTLAELVAFYECANGLLRASIFIALMWPLAALSTAMFLSPARAQSIVPIVDMVPLAAVFCLVLGAPLGFAVLIREPMAKKGFIYFIGFIGIELTIGVYLSLIPVSDDIGLVPLLLLSVMALFFLSIAQIALPVRALLGLLLFAITITFLSGGRAALVAKLHAAMETSNTAQSHSGPVVAPLDPKKPQNAQTEQSAITHALPTPQNQSPSIKDSQVAAPQGQLQKPKQLVPDWANAKSTLLPEYSISMAPCILRAATLYCIFRITNMRNDDPETSIFTRWGSSSARIVDSGGGELQASEVSLGNRRSQTEVTAKLPSNVPIIGYVAFENVSTQGSVGFLEIPCMLRGSASKEFTIQFRDLPIQREAQ